MFRAIWHLFLGSCKLAVGWMGTTWLAVCVLAAPFVIGLGFAYKQNGWRGVKSSFGITTLYTLAVWAGLLFIAAIRFIYLDHQHLKQETARLSKEIETLKSSQDGPIFRPLIDRVLLAPAGEGDKDAMVGVVGKIVNTGSSLGSVIDFSLQLKLKDSRILRAESPAMPEADQKFYIGKNPDGRGVYLLGADNLVRTALAEPIPSQGSAKGWLIGVFRDVTALEAENTGTVLFTCVSANGKSFSVEYPLGEIHKMHKPNEFSLYDIQKRKKH